MCCASKCEPMTKQTCGVIYARIIASLMVPAVALALMAGRALAAEPFFPPEMKPFWEFLEMLSPIFRHVSWLSMTLEKYDPKPSPWNGVWPEPPNRMTIQFEPGGVIKEHIERWQELARSGADVEILGPCYSACTLIVAYVPKERLCFGAFATLQFHLARNPETGKPSLDASAWMVRQYPREIYDWIMERGGVASMTVDTFRELRAPSLWRMGYRQCKRDQ
jgi:hypothetical protein